MADIRSSEIPWKRGITTQSGSVSKYCAVSVTSKEQSLTALSQVVCVRGKVEPPVNVLSCGSPIICNSPDVTLTQIMPRRGRAMALADAPAGEVSALVADAPALSQEDVKLRVAQLNVLRYATPTLALDSRRIMEALRLLGLVTLVAERDRELVE